MSNICGFCYNARLDDELTDDNDYSVMSIGDSSNGYRMMFCSGWGRPPRIETEKWFKNSGWHKIGQYFPKFCPECGREITEYKRNEE